jgi:hypothetical protein
MSGFEKTELQCGLGKAGDDGVLIFNCIIARFSSLALKKNVISMECSGSETTEKSVKVKSL